jgi:protein-tyrosine-phosphatase
MTTQNTITCNIPQQIGRCFDQTLFDEILAMCKKNAAKYRTNDPNKWNDGFIIIDHLDTIK